MKDLFIDLETASSIDLAKAGVYRYVEAEDFQILLFAASVDEGNVKVYDLAHGDDLPAELMAAISDPAVTKWAYNCNFERVCLSRYLGYPVGSYIEPEQFRCVMTWGGYLGLPMSLEKISEIMKLTSGKLDTGKTLIRKFCKAGSRLPVRDDDQWQMFCEYCKRDVEAEMEICKKLSPWPVPESVWQEFFDSERINDRGVAIDKSFVRNVIHISEEVKADITEQMERFTGLQNPNSVTQLKWWLSRQGVETESLDKAAVEELIERRSKELKARSKCGADAREHPQVPCKRATERSEALSESQKTTAFHAMTALSEFKEGIEEDDIVIKVLTMHQQISKSSIAKYKKMLRAVNIDGRVRGMFRFYGANRTGRFVSRIVQLQNLPKNHMADLDEARELVKVGDLKTLKAKYADVQDVLSQLVRTAFVPSALKPSPNGEGVSPAGLTDEVFLVADESSIEARVIAWLAKEKWRMDAFSDGKDIYCESASQMFHVPVEKHGMNAELRPKGKVAELALGFQGGVGALIKMGALKQGLKESELQPIVDAWRAASPRIVKLWYDIGDAALNAVIYRGTTETHGIRFIWEKGFLFIELLSGRRLAYYGARLGTNKFGNDCITYYGLGPTKKWEKLETSPGRLVENIVQATARDVLCYALHNLRECPVVMHIHDEIVVEDDGRLTLDELSAIMGQTPPWASGLQLRADGDEMKYYQKT